MSNKLVTERRAFLKKRFKFCLILTYAIFCVTLYNCIAEFFFPTLVLPVSFYLPQFMANMAKTFSDRIFISVLCALACTALLALLLFCIVRVRKNYRLAGILNVVVSIDVVLLIYIGLQSLLTKGFQSFFVLNLLAHIWMLSLVIRLSRSSEGLEVLPETDEE